LRDDASTRLVRRLLTSTASTAAQGSSPLVCDAQPDRERSWDRQASVTFKAPCSPEPAPDPLTAPERAVGSHLRFEAATHQVMGCRTRKSNTRWSLSHAWPPWYEPVDQDSQLQTRGELADRLTGSRTVAGKSATTASSFGLARHPISEPLPELTRASASSFSVQGSSRAASSLPPQTRASPCGSHNRAPNSSPEEQNPIPFLPGSPFDLQA
jgi:hypothetical protein